MFGINLQYYRKKKGMTQADLAGTINVGQVTIANYERGTRFPGEEKLRALVKSLNVDMNQLFTEISQISHSSKMREFRLSDLFDFLLEEDVSTAAHYIKEWQRMESYSLEQTFSRIMIPTLERTGKLWSTGNLSVSEEHLISGKIREIISVLGQETETKNREIDRELTWIGVCVPADQHELILFMLYHLLRNRGVNAYFLGKEIPASDLIDRIHQLKPQAISISCSRMELYNSLDSYLQLIGPGLSPQSAVFLGGRGVDHNQVKKYTFVKNTADSLDEGFKEIKKWLDIL